MTWEILSLLTSSQVPLSLHFPPQGWSKRVTTSPTRAALWEWKKAARRRLSRKRRSQAWRIAESYCRYGCRCLRVAGSSRAWRAGCVAMPELAVQAVVSTPGAAQCGGSFQSVSGRHGGGLPGPVALPLLSHGRVGYGAAAAGC